MALFHRMERSVVVVDNRRYLLPVPSCEFGAVVKHNIASAIYFTIASVVLQSQPVQISNRLSRNLASIGAEVKGAEVTTRHADAAYLVVRDSGGGVAD
jgi:hypothetical protein